MVPDLTISLNNLFKFMESGVVCLEGKIKLPYRQLIVPILPAFWPIGLVLIQ
ncbi:hypothetical protein N752_11235 [Desulforamulus aquiferis]|nr:hypothetical protein N752_11235 [Desulforamulus aquiferis]